MVIRDYGRAVKVLVRALLFSAGFVLSCSAAADAYGEAATVEELERATVAADGRPIRYPATDSPEVTALLITLPSHGDPAWHHHPVPVYAYLIEGVLKVELKSGKVNVYRAGDAWIEAVDTPHKGRTRGEKPVKLIAFYMGEQGKANTVTQGD